MGPVQKTDLSLQCQIETQSEYELGKPVSVRATLHNRGASAVWMKRTIYVCADAFNDFFLVSWYWHSAAWMRAAILIREISHAAAGTGDETAGWASKSMYLATYELWRAVKNGHNYAMFALDCSPDAPPDSPPDNGIWRGNFVPDGWRTRHSPAAALIAEGAVMTAYREES